MNHDGLLLLVDLVVKKGDAGLHNSFCLFFLARSMAKICPVAAASSGTNLHQFNKKIQVQVEAVVRIVCASVLGSILGSERRSEATKSGAGQRTMALVSLGACVFTICGQGFVMEVAREAAKGPNALPGIENASVDASRMASTITTGVGFLGAGVISNNRMPDGRFDPESAKRGLTTAATIWMAAAVGSAVGAGLYYAGVAFLLSSLFVLGIGKRLDTGALREKVVLSRQIIAADNPVDSDINATRSVTGSSGSNTTTTTLEYKVSSMEADDDSKVGSTNTKTTWLEGLDGSDSTSHGKKGPLVEAVTTTSSTRKKECIEGVEGTLVNSTSVDTPKVEVKEAKKVDHYVDKFLKAADVRNKDTVVDEEENESQQIIW